MRVAFEEAAHLRTDEAAAEGFGAGDTQVPGEPQAGAGDLLAGGLQGAFQRFGMAQQALALDGEGEAGGARLLEQQRPQALFQGTNAPRHRGVVHPQTTRGGAGGASTRHFEEETQVVPVEFVAHRAFLHISPCFCGYA